MFLGREKVRSMLQTFIVAAWYKLLFDKILLDLCKKKIHEERRKSKRMPETWG